MYNIYPFDIMYNIYSILCVCVYICQIVKMLDYKTHWISKVNVKIYEIYIEELRSWYVAPELKKKTQVIAIALPLPKHDPSNA